MAACWATKLCRIRGATDEKLKVNGALACGGMLGNEALQDTSGHGSENEDR